jgi:hypothetical protein
MSQQNTDHSYRVGDLVTERTTAYGGKRHWYITHVLSAEFVVLHGIDEPGDSPWLEMAERGKIIPAWISARDLEGDARFEHRSRS